MIDEHDTHWHEEAKNRSLAAALVISLGLATICAGAAILQGIAFNMKRKRN